MAAQQALAEAYAAGQLLPFGRHLVAFQLQLQRVGAGHEAVGQGRLHGAVERVDEGQGGVDGSHLLLQSRHEVVGRLDVLYHVAGLHVGL